MAISDWWWRISEPSRQWLIEHNGEAVRGDIVAEIAGAGGVVTSDAWWVGTEGPTGFFLSERAVDWVEAVANGEAPE
ncbi:hypothetical protein LLS1_18670 [Leifsonia sp. LS1]|uniref:hypothetical protein n=1 Tax=Leifsonia sp. LS1 TaxID=2828483 RepID=UPI001CFC8BE9|nr:hypothetical protein [Leifsonia sp. LS1]GIT80198.1 hypothetical protein LLS1_18670 [Leifsonia sp. LS1]